MEIRRVAAPNVMSRFAEVEPAPEDAEGHGQ
jgi:hypothetical protein